MMPHIQPSRVLVGGVLPVSAERAIRTPVVELGWPGLEPARPCLDIIVFDSSGSVIAPVGNDPVGNRFEEARRAIRLVSHWTVSDRSKVAVVHLDHPQGASGVVALNNRNLSRIVGPSLQNPGGAGTSDLLPSVVEMERLAATYPDHDVRTTIFSDFELTDARPEEVFARLSSFPGLIHAVVLGGDVPPDLLQDNIIVTPLAPEDAPGTLAAAILRSLVTTRRSARFSVLHTPHGNRVLR